MIIGIFGAIGSGKSTICKEFIKKHPEYEWIELDKIGKKIIDKKETKDFLYNIDNNLVKNNTVDINYYRKKLFTNNEFAKIANKYNWYLISKLLNKMISNKQNIIIEGALLEKIKINKKYDLLVKVETNILTSLYRTLRRDKRSLIETLSIIKKQKKIIKTFKYDIKIKNINQLLNYYETINSK